MERILNNKPVNLCEYYRLRWNEIVRERKRFSEENINLQITAAAFFPAITFTGLQPFVLVGC